MQPLTKKGILLGLILLLIAIASTLVVYKVQTSRTSEPGSETTVEAISETQ